MKSIKVIILEAGEGYTDKVDETMVAYNDNETTLLEDAIETVEDMGYRIMLDVEGGCCEYVQTDGEDYIAITVWPGEGEKMWEHKMDGHNGMVLGYWDGGPVVVAEGYGVAEATEGDCIVFDASGGRWYAMVYDGEWELAHQSNYGNHTPATQELTFSAHDEIAEATGYDVGEV